MKRSNRTTGDTSITKNKYKKIPVIFFIFFADFFVFDITWTFENWDHSNFPVK